MTSMLKLTNTATGKKAPFSPVNPRSIGMYVCGPTVYDRAHIGNARSAVVFDLLYRLLRHLHGEEAVTYARNFTDIDDKIIGRAAALWPDEAPQERISRLTHHTMAQYRDDMGRLGVLTPGHEPRATGFIPAMIEDISSIMARGAAYVRDGHVFFRADKNPDPGALSGRKPDDEAVHRIEPSPLKDDPADFVLWKPSGADEPGWDSPWGRGRPGWHIECSAMATRLLGVEFDIHGGGGDLVFPHHDNEIAQAKCCHPGSGYARTWLHNGMVRVSGQKMSKSLGNFITAHDLLKGLPGGAIRLGLLSAHYRADLDWTDTLESRSLALWRKWRDLAMTAEPGPIPEPVLAALCDDMNTAQAISEMHRLFEAQDAAGLRAALDLLGIPLDREISDELADLVDRLVQRRDVLRRQKRDFAAADALRDSLASAGICVRDGAGGASWEVSGRIDDQSIHELASGLDV